MSVRVRFAPSPTGPFHIGGARTALFNWLFARKQKGIFVLRIEDTDRARSSDAHLQDAYSCLRWLGLEWDEGPAPGTPLDRRDPHFQTSRQERHHEVARELVAKGRAYEELTDKGTAIVFRIDRAPVAWKDAVHGDMSRDLTEDKDLVLIKSDGTPTYNFACVVDDLDMAITHVIRGDDHVSNTPKQICLYRALGKEHPVFAHIPLILNPDGSKMSKDYKKKGKSGEEITIPTHVSEYRTLGFTPDGMVNFLSLLGWSPGDDAEIMPREELVRRFSLDRVIAHPAQFNYDKLVWLNGHYIRQTPAEAALAECRDRLRAAGCPVDGVPVEALARLVAMNQEKLKTWADVVPASAFYFRAPEAYDEKAVQKHVRKPGALDLLKESRALLAGVASWSTEAVSAALNGLVTAKGLKFLAVAQPLRVALTGVDVSPPIDQTLALLGKDEALKRIDRAIGAFTA